MRKKTRRFEAEVKRDQWQRVKGGTSEREVEDRQGNGTEKSG